MDNSRDKVEVNWTPEGEWIAFGCGVFPNTDPKSNLYIMRPDGSELQRITTDEFVATSPSWSPDGQWIAFLSKDTIFKTKSDGAQIEKILSLSPLETGGSVVWSPNGEWVAYNVYGLQNNSIQRVRPDGTERSIIVQGSGAFAIQKWSPDSHAIAYADISSSPSSGIYIVDRDGKHVKEVLEYRGIKDDLNWFPNGNELLLSLPNGQQKRLFRLNLNSNELTPIKADYFWDSSALSPNGEWIVYSGYDKDGGDPLQIYKARSDGNEAERLTQMNECNAFDPRWFDFNSINS
jgi:Tol biopolymer transport system component